MMAQQSASPEHRILTHLAENELINIQQARAQIISQEADFAKWMIASLLALNGGAVLATWSSEQILPSWRAAASVIYVIGIMAALSVSHFIYLANRGILQSLQEWEAYWLFVAETGEHEHVRRGRLDTNFQTAFAKTAKTQWAGMLSAVSFLIGCVVAAIGGSLV